MLLVRILISRSDYVRDFEVYRKCVQKMKDYFGEQYDEQLFLQGGCFWFAEFLHRHTMQSFIMMNKEKEHCAIEIGNELYDITGKIPKRGYNWATKRNLEYMKKQYTPSFNVLKLERYLTKEMS